MAGKRETGRPFTLRPMRESHLGGHPKDEGDPKQCRRTLENRRCCWECSTLRKQCVKKTSDWGAGLFEELQEGIKSCVLFGRQSRGQTTQAYKAILKTLEFILKTRENSRFAGKGVTGFDVCFK